MDLEGRLSTLLKGHYGTLLHANRGQGWSRITRLQVNDGNALSYLGCRTRWKAQQSIALGGLRRALHAHACADDSGHQCTAMGYMRDMHGIVDCAKRSRPLIEGWSRCCAALSLYAWAIKLFWST
jgi:hypothetical protein